MVTQNTFNLHRTVTYNQALDIGQLSLLSTVSKDSIVNAINELLGSTSGIGNLASLTTDDKTTIVDAINEVDGNVDTNAGNIGTLSSLTTTDKSSMVNAINEHDGEIGDISTLQTTDMSSVVNAINSIFSSLASVSCTSNVASTYSAALCCGNSVIEGVENCDDGNQISGDGCSENCKLDFLELSALDGTNGIVFYGTVAGEESGTSLTNIGDFNGDNIDDIAIGAPLAPPNGNAASGATYVVFGFKANIPASFNLQNLDGTDGFVINGIDADDNSGNSVIGNVDFNGDGIKDLIIGAPFSDANGSDSGEVYVVFGAVGGFSASMELSTLDGNNGFVMNGIAAGDQAGISLGSAGDFDGDGIEDIIIGANQADPNGSSSGQIYIVFGNESSFGTSFELSALDGTNGIIINGIGSPDSAGVSVGIAGDFNGDGFDDVVIGATLGNSVTGQVYVIFGGQSLASPFELSTLNGINGVIFNGISASDLAGLSVGGFGDFNDDGISDILIGAIGADPNGNTDAGSVYVVFGSKTFTSPFALSSLDGTNGVIYNGIDAADSTGISTMFAGDINSDGISDIVIGAEGADTNGLEAGEAYVVYGKSTSFSSPIELSSLDGDTGFVINGIAAGDNAGRAVSTAGDFNGDGNSDFLIGAYKADGNSNNESGSTYVVFG